LKGKPTDDELLQVYGLFKQGTVGDVNTSTCCLLNDYIHTLCFISTLFTGRPGMLDLKGKAKWDAWNTHKGSTQEEAKKKYVELVKTLIEKYGL
jgi:diazepam-binding inhibitor (GABA receptor modulating acyl-CoA-binding protein)